MAFWSQCGQQLATSDEFCRGCGQRIAKATGEHREKAVEALPKKRVITPARAVIGLVLVGVLLFGGLSIAAFFARGGFCFTKCAKQCEGVTSLEHDAAVTRCQSRCTICCTGGLPQDFSCSQPGHATRKDVQKRFQPMIRELFEKNRDTFAQIPQLAAENERKDFAARCFQQALPRWMPRHPEDALMIATLTYQDCEKAAQKIVSRVLSSAPELK